MGDYTVLHGKLQIKPELIEILRPRFTYDGTPANEHAWPAWKYINLPDEIKNTLAFQTLAHPCSRGDVVPGSNSLNDGGMMTFSDDGLLEFNCAHKNKSCDSLRAFIALFPLIAQSWDVTLDMTDFIWEEDGGIERLSSETDPTLKEHIENFEKYAWMKNKCFLLEENNSIVSDILQRVGNYGNSSWVPHKALHIIPAKGSVFGVPEVPRGYEGNGLPKAIMLKESANKRMILIVEIDHVLETIKVVFPGITKQGDPHVFKLDYGYALISNPKYTLIGLARQFITDGTIPATGE